MARGAAHRRRVDQHRRALRGVKGGGESPPARQAQHEVEDLLAQENNLGAKAKDARFDRWYECSLCEQSYHGVVRCALGWACWKTYARALHDNPSATLDDLREAVSTLEDTTRIARRVLGGAHPLTTAIVSDLRHARAAHAAHETPPTDARKDGDLDEVEEA